MMIGCENVIGRETTTADVAAFESAAQLPFPSMNDTFNGSCYTVPNQTPVGIIANLPRSSGNQVLVGPNSDRSQNVVEEKAGPSSPLDALALACAAQDMCAQDTIPPKSDASAASTLIVSNESHQNDVTNPVREADVASLSSPSFQLTNNDVLCGRGGLTNHHPGNVFFRRMVRMRQEDYLRASKRDKAGVARDIVDTIRKLDPSGRFLKKDKNKPGQWVEIGNRKAREKTSQALREGAPEKREELSGHATVPSGTAVADPESVQLFTNTSITPSEMDQAARASVGCVQRARVVSSDSDGGTVGFAPFQEAFYPQGLATSTSFHHVSNESFCGSPTPMVTPIVTPSSTCTITSKLEPMDASSGRGNGLPAPPLFCGMKRKLENSACSFRDQQMQDAEAHQRSPGGSKRGPRLRIFKERMMDLCH